MSDQDPFDDRIRRGLDDLGAGASAAAAPMTPTEVRQRGTRRRYVVTTASITAILVVMGGGSVLLASDNDSTGLEPVVTPTTTTAAASTPTPTSETVPPSSATTPAEITTPPFTPPPTEPPAPPPSATVGPWPAGDPATEIPDGLQLPREGDTSDNPEFSDWVTGELLDTPWAWDVCGADSVDADALRTDYRQVSMTGPEAGATKSLAVFGSAFDAVDAMSQLRVAIETCDDSSPEYVTDWDLRTTDIGGESFVAASRTTLADGGAGSGGHLLVAVRIGSAIYVGYGAADGPSGVDTSYAFALEDEARIFAPNLCVFTMAGCPG